MSGAAAAARGHSGMLLTFYLRGRKGRRKVREGRERGRGKRLAKGKWEGRKDDK